MFYTVNQNNSGGYYIQNDEVDVFVIIEANSLEQFRKKAKDIFSAYRISCPCCGERWDDDWLDEEDPTTTPTIYGEELEDISDKYLYYGKTKIYYLNGTKRTYNLETKKYE